MADERQVLGPVRPHALQQPRLQRLDARTRRGDQGSADTACRAGQGWAQPVKVGGAGVEHVWLRLP